MSDLENESSSDDVGDDEANGEPDGDGLRGVVLLRHKI